ncbi:MAG: hypothetical protein ACPGJS_17980 [Flammeovirgaceae bacterium]
MRAVDFKHSIVLLILAFSLPSCTHNATKIIGKWESADAETEIRAQTLSFNYKQGMYWHISATDSMRYRYDVEGEKLLTMNRYGLFNYHILKLSKKQLILQHEEDASQVFRFKRKEKYPRPPKKKKNAPHIPVEKDIYDLIYALTGPNVEVRLKNLLDEFQEGDYVTTKTLYHLTGVSAYKKRGELPDAASHRNVITKIQKIERIGDQFRATLANDEDIDAAIPIYKRKGEKREIQRVLDVHIEKNAVIRIQSDERHVKIDIDGVRIGKGWFKIGIPTLTISGDYGRLLGLRFYLAR